MKELKIDDKIIYDQKWDIIGGRKKKRRILVSFFFFVPITFYPSSHSRSQVGLIVIVFSLLDFNIFVQASCSLISLEIHIIPRQSIHLELFLILLLSVLLFLCFCHKYFLSLYIVFSIISFSCQTHPPCSFRVFKVGFYLFFKYYLWVYFPTNLPMVKCAVFISPLIQVLEGLL